MMTSQQMEQVLRDVDVRTSTIEQILPTLATKQDLERFATKADLERCATKDDLTPFATTVELRREIDKAVVMLRGEIKASRRHARLLHEDVKADIRMLAEHMVAIIERLDRLERR